jgi:hypothetical protein
MTPVRLEAIKKMTGRLVKSGSLCGGIRIKAGIVSNNAQIATCGRTDLSFTGWEFM